MKSCAVHTSYRFPRTVASWSVIRRLFDECCKSFFFVLASLMTKLLYFEYKICTKRKLSASLCRLGLSQYFCYKKCYFKYELVLFIHN